MGLALIIHASKALGGDKNGLEKAEKLIEKYGEECPYQADELLPLVKNDKKAESDSINAVLVKNIGECYVKKMAFADFERLFR